MSNDPTLYEWLSSQPPEFQSKAIGERNAAKLRSGEIGSKKFAAMRLGKRFAPMTLQDMESLDGMVIGDE